MPAHPRASGKGERHREPGVSSTDRTRGRPPARCRVALLNLPLPVSARLTIGQTQDLPTPGHCYCPRVSRPWRGACGARVDRSREICLCVTSISYLDHQGLWSELDPVRRLCERTSSNTRPSPIPKPNVGGGGASSSVVPRDLNEPAPHDATAIGSRIFAADGGLRPDHPLQAVRPIPLARRSSWVRRTTHARRIRGQWGSSSLVAFGAVGCCVWHALGRKIQRNSFLTF
jgi:hypothetical protein